ncbi:hypothetical protein PNOK_0104100 [Pyrrhoderma noxium]|uniref:ABM domain-containing protein n=1 Tax=Pyrrhoderma noxium TaxID=2282107 RepID=A0A286UWJ1_9AGAM|nr:hypothetical protein PNOK_0104100 [Pyrrhoderma noxium]
MPITELATLQLKPGKTWADILPLIQTASREQSSWSGYPLYFFDDIHTPGLFYLLSGWESVHAHEQWIASPTNQDLVKALTPNCDVLGLRHLIISPDESWKDAAMMLYVRTEEGKQPSLPEVNLVWKGFGGDAEGKNKDIVYLIVYNNDESEIPACANVSDQEVRWLRRHDIN